MKVADGKVEAPLLKVTGVTTEQVLRASSKTSLDLWDVYSLAVERTERLASKAEDVEQADAQSQQAIGAVLPHLYLNANKNYQSSNYIGGLTGGFTSSTIPSNSLYLSGTQTIFTGLNEVSAIQGAQATQSLHRFGLKNESSRLLLDVARSFYSVLQLEESLKSKGASRELTEKIFSQLRKWQAVGRSRRSEVLSTQAQLAQLVGDLKDTQNQLVQARESLAQLAGLKPDTALTPAEDGFLALSSLTQEAAESRIEDRPDVKQAEAAVEVAEAYALQAHGLHLPSLSLQGNYYVLKDGGFPSPEWNLQVLASLPLFEGGQIVAQERQSDSKLSQAKLQLSLARRAAREEIRQVYQGLGSSLQESDAYQKALEAAEEAYQAVARDYRSNLTTNLEVLQTLNTLEAAKNNYARARYQTLLDKVWLGVAIGELPKTTK